MCSDRTPIIFAVVSLTFIAVALLLSRHFVRKARSRCVERYPSFWIMFFAGVSQLGASKTPLIPLDSRDDPVVRRYQRLLGIYLFAAFGMLSIVFLVGTSC